MRRYEPVLAFADKERFHPLAVEAYLACCDLFARARGWRRWLRRSRRVTLEWDRRAGASAEESRGETGARRAGVLDSFGALHFLRFLDPGARKTRQAGRQGETAAKPPWIGFAAIVFLLGLGTWYAFHSGWARLGKGLLFGLGVVLAAMLFAWMFQRFGADRAIAILLSLFSVALLAVVFQAWKEQASWLAWAALGEGVLVAGVVQTWGRIFLTWRAAGALNRISAAPILLSVIWVLSAKALGLAWVTLVSGLAAVVLLLLLSDDLAAAYMAVFSSLRRGASAQAVAIEAELRQRSESRVYPYYGRVWKEPDGPRVALQYFFFYAFNDWRGQGGLNFHEADWEWATVFLRRQGDEYVPEAVALSQHHSIGRRPWNDMELANGSHPVVYVAVGSHANYFEPARRALVDLVDESRFKVLLTFVFKSRAKSRQAAEEGVAVSQSLLGRKAAEPTRDLTTADDPNGRGLVIGPVRPSGVPAQQERTEWRQVVLDGTEPWIGYRGLWGRKSLLRNESGPPGPKWEREENLTRGERESGRRRLVWENPLAAP